MKMIGLAGAAGAGKDTLASWILEHQTGRSFAFADPLRHAASAIFGLTPHQMQDRVAKEAVLSHWGKSPRELLQLLGTEGVRDVFGGDTWVKRAQITVDQYLAQLSYEPFHPQVMIWTDVRFDEEAQWIKDNGGVVINIERVGVSLVGIAEHRSASGISENLVDETFYNSGSLEDLRLNALGDLPSWLALAGDLPQEQRFYKKSA